MYTANRRDDSKYKGCSPLLHILTVVATLFHEDNEYALGLNGLSFTHKIIKIK